MPTADRQEPANGMGLGGLWNPAGPRESATTHIISPQRLLSDNPGTRPSAVDNSAGLPPVGNQWNQGSCTAWAIGYYHTTYIENRESPIDMTDPDNQTSPAFLYNMANGGMDGGSYSEDVADLLISNGACSMAEKPYNSGDCVSWPSEDWIWVSGMKRKAVSQNWLNIEDSEGMEALKAHLAAGNTATTGIEVYSNFDNIESYNNTYCSSERDVGETTRGGHCVLICGYNETMPTADGVGAFRMVNSWGTDWGDAGYWWMTPEALVDGFLGYGWVMYMESEVNYTPRMVAKANIDHDFRGDIVRNYGVEVGVIENTILKASKPFLGCFYIEDWFISEGYPLQQHPFPAGTMAFDITEFLPYMDPLSDHDFQLTLNNAGDDAGELLTFEALNAEWWEGGICNEVPMAIEPSTCNYALGFAIPDMFYHYPIRADGDSGLAHRAIGEFWQGSGTPADPYIIPGYTIDGTGLGNCIYVGNTTADFVIRDCLIEGASSAEWSDYYGDSSILLYQTTGGTLEGNVLSASFLGIYLMMCEGALVEGNNITGNDFGMDMSFCSNIIVRQNNVTDNLEYGIAMAFGDSNEVYHNNIIGNPVQAYDDSGLNFWDSGYPSGGNYWSDYTGVDLMSGPLQDQPGSDGIGDTPYAIPEGGAGAQDEYPLMVLWSAPSGPVHNIDTGEYFSGIQAAIDDVDTLSGHTIVVANGIYYENVLINKKLNLIGEDRTQTIIDGGGGNYVIKSQYSWTNISGFTIRNALDRGIDLDGLYCHISDIVVENCATGIYLVDPCYHTIEYCILKNNDFGMWIRLSYAGTIRYCCFENNTNYAIYMEGGEGNPHSYSIYNNSFWFNNGATLTYDSNHVQAADVWPIDGGNDWDDTTGHGNFWCDWTTPDNDGNGIVDVPYILDYAFPETISQDNYPLSVPWGTPPPPSYIIPLVQGWNLISIPLEMTDTSVGNVLSSISGMYDSVKYFDTLDIMDPWKSYRVNGTANDLAAIDMTMGVWVHVTGNCMLEVQGEIAESTQITLHAGWNLVGYPAQTERMVGESLWGTGADRVEVFDIASPGMISAVAPEYMMAPGNGYWVHVVADSVWTITW